MIRRTCRALSVVALAFAAVSAAAPSAGSSVAGAVVRHHASSTVRAAALSVGDVLVDGSGRTVYVFSSDAHKVPTCTGGCAAVWRPLLVRHKPLAGPGTRKALLGTVRVHGRLQVTYGRWPLYTFVEDTTQGQANGQGMKAFGGTWSTIAPSGESPFTAAAKSSGGGGGGYGGYGGYGGHGGSGGPGAAGSGSGW